MDGREKRHGEGATQGRGENVLVIVQARMGSTRFPGKVLAPVLHQPMLLWQLDRLQRLPTPHDLVVALPVEEDDALETCLIDHGYAIASVIGDPTDVLRRFVEVLKFYPASETIVRVTGDCPLLDPLVVEELLARHQDTRSDYTALAAAWPDGLDCEVMTRSAVLRAHDLASTPSDREHVTPVIWRRGRPSFTTDLLPCPFDLSKHCWSVDTPEDRTRVQELLRLVLARAGFGFGWRDVLAVLEDEPHLHLWAIHRMRNVAYMRQIADETDASRPPRDAWFTQRYGKKET